MAAAATNRIAETRELLRNWSRPFLMRTYDAAVEDYLEIADEDFKVEYADGELIVHSPATLRHEDIGLFLGMLVRDYVSRQRLGFVWGPNAVMQLAPSRYFSPDLSFLSSANDSRMMNERVVGPMDLAVEILSKSTRAYDRGDKLNAFLAGRVPEVWLIDPDETTFEARVLHGDVYRAHTLREGRWTSSVIPGFSLDVAWLWRKPLPSLAECGV
ncbi:hypothetical protein RAS1_28920 [Phycisphaerae bacterium RAS1]|nr:hypothetical protein RAS1_28920 [Phycisphaerae bacterium RAS1]